jgi:hypothetical protein
MANVSAIIETYGTVRLDGTLQLDQQLALPIGRVKVRVEPVQSEVGQGWPPGYSDLFGSIDDDTLTVHPQPPLPPAVVVE